MVPLLRARCFRRGVADAPHILIAAATIDRNGCRFPDRNVGRTRQHLDRGGELDAVEMLHQGNDITTLGAAPAMPALLAGMDGKAISAAAYRARSN
jgi:hypothetical protein